MFEFLVIFWGRIDFASSFAMLSNDWWTCCKVLYIMWLYVFWLPSSSAEVLVYKISLVSLIQINILLNYLNGTPPSKIHLLMSFLKVLRFCCNFSEISVFDIALIPISIGRVLHSLDAYKLKLLHDALLNRGTVKYLLWGLAGVSLSLISSDDPKLIIL